MMIYSRSKEETSKSSEQHYIWEPSANTEQIIAGNCAVLMKSQPWKINRIIQGQKKEH